MSFLLDTNILLIASMALLHGLTLVTHNTADFQNIPGLRLDDWLTHPAAPTKNPAPIATGRNM